MKQNTALTLGFLLALSLPGISLADDDEEERSSLLRPATNANWKTECGSCHMAYHPGLLPARSWRKMMGGLDKHFGQDASLEPIPQKDITNFLVMYSADQGNIKYAKSVPAASTPLRITETTWFKREHDEIRAAVWKRKKIGSASNCMACHKGAEQGDFSEDKVAIPR